MTKDVGVASHQHHHNQHEDYHEDEAESHLLELGVSIELAPVKDDHRQLSSDQPADGSRCTNCCLVIVASTGEHVSEDSVN